MYYVKNHQLNHLLVDSPDYLFTWQNLYWKDICILSHFSTHSRIFLIHKSIAFLFKLRISKSAENNCKFMPWPTIQSIENYIQDRLNAKTYPILQTLFTIDYNEAYINGRAKFLYAIRSNSHFVFFSAKYLGWIIKRLNKSEYFNIEYRIEEKENIILLHTYGNNRLLAVLENLDYKDECFT